MILYSWFLVEKHIVDPDTLVYRHKDYDGHQDCHILRLHYFVSQFW